MVIKRYLKKLIFCCAFFSIPALAYETQLSLGWQTFSAKQLTGDSSIDSQKENGSSALIGFTIHNRNGNNERHHLGAGIEISEVLDTTLTGFRAIDYRYHLNQSLSYGLFLGAASLDSGLPQNGYFAGISGHWQISNGPFGLGFEFRRAEGLGRDRLLDDDPEGEKPDIFIDVDSVLFSLYWNIK
ncbi:MAG: hypothetical protein K6L76_03530 [Agarilytica sp.]